MATIRNFASFPFLFSAKNRAQKKTNRNKNPIFAKQKEALYAKIESKKKLNNNERESFYQRK